MNSYKTTLRGLYDKYILMLFSIALEISPSTQEAESIIVKAFQNIDLQKVLQQKPSLLGMTLIKTLMQTARHEFFPGQDKNNFKLKRFQKTPLLHQIFCEQAGMKNYCEENNITTQEAMKQLRHEWTVLQVSGSVMSLSSIETLLPEDNFTNR